MAEPTDLPDGDVKELKAELGGVRAEVGAVAAVVHRIEVSIDELRVELKFLLAVATWGLKVVGLCALAIVAFIIAGAVGIAWWASSINSEVRDLAVQVAEVRKAVDVRQAVPVTRPPGPPVEIREVPPKP
jgi:hypothetical protein